jgi:small-conductance mechanosensitive channel
MASKKALPAGKPFPSTNGILCGACHDVIRVDRSVQTDAQAKAVRPDDGTASGAVVPFWHRLIVLGVVLLVTVIVARLVDRRMARRDLPAGLVTRYRVLRRSVLTGIVFVGLLSALLVIPQVRAVATGILASSAIVGIVVGFAAQRTIGNFIAGLLIAFTQPIRLGDYVEIEGQWGVVEEIGLTYTFIRVTDNDRLVIPNERIASDTIRNSSIRGRKKLAQVTVQVPLDHDLDAVGRLLREAAGDESADVAVAALDDKAQLTVSVWADDEPAAMRLESALRLRAHQRLREAGVFA